MLLTKTQLTAIAIIPMLTACGVDSLDLPTIKPASHTVSFTGQVYDGATRQRLSDYGIELLIADDFISATFSESIPGRFLLGPFSPLDDYSIHIVADGYREFWSHNQNVASTTLATEGFDPNTDNHQVRHYDAYLFPDDIQSPEATFSIRAESTGDKLSGTIRFRPTNASSLASAGNADTPPGIETQLWTNDEDLQSATVTQSFSDGQFTLAAGSLVYGVTYQLLIYDVGGYKLFTDNYQAGIDENRTLILEKLEVEDLFVITENSDQCAPPAAITDSTSAIVNIEFNQAIELTDGAAETLDNGLSIDSPNADNDTVSNQLAPDADADVQERGTTLVANDKILSLNWDPSVGIDPLNKDPDDPIIKVTYGSLSSVLIQRVGEPDTATSLSALLNKSLIDCE